MVSFEEFINIKFDFKDIDEKNPVVGNRDIFWLYHEVVKILFNALNIKSLLEVGPWDGGVFRTICGCKYKPQIYTMVDSWGEQFLGVVTKDYSHIDKIALDLKYPYELDKITGDSTIILPKFIEEGRKYELVLIDGGHKPSVTSSDLFCGWRLVADKGLMVVDDVHSRYLHEMYKETMIFYLQHYKEAFLIKDVYYPKHPGCFIFMKNP